MERWDVTIEIVEQLAAAELQRLRRELGPQSVVRQLTEGTQSRVSIEAIGVEVAGAQALTAYRQARAKAELAKRTITRIDIARRHLEQSASDLMGIAEIAQLIGVTRQRASKLAQSARFPGSVARLQSGPVWLASDVHDFVGTWERRRGRPRKAAAT